jgi:hypothetical protein
MLCTCTNKLDSPKENPFASYSFDPNNIENSLDSNANRSIEQVQTQSIIPNGKSNANCFAESSRVAQSFRTPGNRRRSTAVSSRISSARVLQQKAAELQQQHPQMIAPRFTVGNGYNSSGYPAENGMRINQYEQFLETDYPNDPGMKSQNTYFYDRPVTSAGSIMHWSFNMDPSNRTPPPYNIQYSSNVGIPQNNTFMRGPTTANGMAAPSFTQRPISRMNVNNFDQSMMYRANAHPYQAYNFQSENDLQFMHGNTYPGYHHRMCQQQNDPFYPGFDPRAHQVDYSTTEAFYGHALGNRSTSDHSSYGVGGMSSSVFQTCSFGNRNSHTPTATRSGAGYANVHNPYQHDPPHLQQQACITMNQYKTNRQQRQPFYHGEGMTNSDYPPMQEVVVQNTSVRSGLAEDDTSRFDEAFL